MEQKKGKNNRQSPLCGNFSASWRKVIAARKWGTDDHKKKPRTGGVFRVS
jgi:hypothetical protein